MLKKSVLACVSIVVCLLLGELAVRLLHLAPGVNRIRVDMAHGSFESSTNSVLRYVPSPGSSGISSYGIRDREYPRSKGAKTRRILVIGDSVGYGFCNDREVMAVNDVFAKQLERAYAGSEAPVEVINLCVSGYDTVQEVEFLVRKGLALDPDVVVVAYCLNDDFEASAELITLQRNPQFALESGIGRDLVLRSHLARVIWLRHAKPESGSATRASAAGATTASRTELGFERLASLARRNGFQPVVVVFPLFEPAASYRWHPQHRRVNELATRFGFPVLDLFESFSVASEGDLRRLQGRCNREHPDERGHRVAAAEIRKFLAARGLVDAGQGNGGGSGGNSPRVETR